MARRLQWGREDRGHCGERLPVACLGPGPRAAELWCMDSLGKLVGTLPGESAGDVDECLLYKW